MKRIIYSISACLIASSVSAQVVSNATFFVSEGAVVSVGMDVQNNGQLTNNGKLHLQKSLTNNGEIQSKGSVVFDGYEKQILNGNKLALANVQLNNDVELATPLTVSESMAFRKGVIATAGNNTLTFGETASHDGASDFSHVVGNVNKLGASKFEFPVGDGTNYRGFEVTSNDKTNFSAEYFAKSTSSVSNEISEGVDAINEYEYWLLSSSSDNAIAKVNLASSVNDLDQLAYLRKGAWTVSEDNTLSEAMGLRKGILFTAGRGRLVKQEIGVWPNPTTGEFNLKLAGMNDNDEVEVDITNQNGRVVMHSKGLVKDLRKAYTLPQNLPTTELTVRVINGNEALTQKLVLNR